MKYILTTLEGGIFGPFTTIEKVDNGYMCDNESYQTTVTGEVTVSEVPDDYTISTATIAVTETPTEPVVTPTEPVVTPDTTQGAV